jgi:hypothetical protein
MVLAWRCQHVPLPVPAGTKYVLGCATSQYSQAELSSRSVIVQVSGGTVIGKPGGQHQVGC